MRTEILRSRTKNIFHFFLKSERDEIWNRPINHYLEIQNKEFNTKYILKFPTQNCATAFWQQLDIELCKCPYEIMQSEIDDCLIDVSRKFEGAFMLEQLGKVL